MPPYVFLLSTSIRDPPGPLSKSLCLQNPTRPRSVTDVVFLAWRRCGCSLLRLGNARASLPWCVPPAFCRHWALRKQDWMSFRGVTPSGLRASCLCGGGRRPTPAAPSEETRPPRPSEEQTAVLRARGRGLPGSLRGRRPSVCLAPLAEPGPSVH